MKAINIKLTKGNSVIWASVHGHDERGNATEIDSETTGYYANGAAGSMSDYATKAEAMASMYAKVGMKVADGYKAERV